MLAHVIHSSVRTDRLALLESEAGVQGFKYVLHEAVLDRIPATGISRAHRGIVAAAKVAGDREVLVMEDDVRFTAPGAFDYYIRKMPREYDIYLGGIMSGLPDGRGVVREFSGMHCYVVREEFYDTFLRAPDGWNIDRWVSGRGLFAVCVPMVAFQHDGVSDNSGKMMRMRGMIGKYRSFS